MHISIAKEMTEQQIVICITMTDPGLHVNLAILYANTGKK